VIEKLPTNYLYLGAIRRALPNAHIVWVSRAPLDSCFAMFRTLFGDAYPFTYDFAELARYYAAYAGLMNHWRSVLGRAVHEVIYEDLVREPARVGESTDIRRATTLVATGREAVRQRDVERLKLVVRELWQLDPVDREDQVRGFGSGLRAQ
jgi:hypothetical protein